MIIGSCSLAPPESSTLRGNQDCLILLSAVLQTKAVSYQHNESWINSQSEGVCGFGLQGQSDLLRGAKMDSLDSLRQLALACEACGLTSSSSSNSSSSSISADHYYSSHPLPGRRSSSHGNGRIWGVSHRRRRCECRTADGGCSELRPDPSSPELSL